MKTLGLLNAVDYLWRNKNESQFNYFPFCFDIISQLSAIKKIIEFSIFMSSGAFFVGALGVCEIMVKGGLIDDEEVLLVNVMNCNDWLGSESD